MRALATLALAAVLVGACSSSATTTTSPGVGVEFGSGSLPETVPEAFPIPAVARVGSTLVDHDRGWTEVVLTFPSALGDVVSYFQTNLPARGFEILSSEGTETSWELTFEGPGASGEIRIEAQGSGLSAAAVRLVEG